MKPSLRRKLLGSLVFVLAWIVIVGAANLYAIVTIRSHQQSQAQQSAAGVQGRAGVVDDNDWQRQNLALALIPLAVVPALAFALYVIRQTTDALAVVSNAARLIASGDLDWSAKVHTGDEIEAIAESLDEIARKAKRALAAKHEADEQRLRQARQQSESTRAFAAEQERLLTALSLVGDSVVVTDARGRIVWINKAATNLTGWPLGQVAGQPFGQVIHFLDEATGQRCCDPAARALEAGQTGILTNHSCLEARSGTLHTVAHLSAPVRDSDGDIVGAVVIFHEVDSEGQEP